MMVLTGIFSALLLLAPQVGQAPAGPAEAPAAAQAQPQAHDPNYRVGPADVLSVRVLGLEEYKQKTAPWIEVTVSNSGKVGLPYIGILKVVGMTVKEVEAEIARGFRERELVKDPQVTVGVQAYRSQTVYLLGEVAQAGQYYMREDMHVMDLIGLSLGVPTEGTMYLYRRVAADTTSGGQPGETALGPAIPLDIQALAEGTRPELNMKLEAGDILYIPYNRPKYYFVTGDVLSPGSFEMPPRRDLMISEAIAFAGGPTKTAKASKGILIRFDEQGQRQQLEVDFTAILEGRTPNFAVQPNDIVFIPGSQTKTFAQGFLRFLPNIALLALW